MRAIVLSLLAALVAAGGPSAWPDVIILKDGSTLECKIKEEKYPDPKNKGRFVLVVETDEKGTIKQIQNTDIKRDGSNYLIFKGKTSWEKRAAYEKEYATRVKSVKETWESRQALGKWCKSHLLPEKAEENYKIAYKLRSGALDPAKVKDPLAEYLKLAKWCEKDLGLYAEAEKEYAKAYEYKKKEVGADDAGKLANLGKWCEQVGLEDQAVAEYTKALELDPKNAVAKASLDRIQSSIEFKTKQLAADYDKNARAWHFTVAIEENVDKKFLEEWGEKIQDLSDYIFVITEGQFFIADCEIEDNTSDAKIIIEKGKLDWRGLNNKQGSGVLAYCQASGTPQWEVHAPGKAAVSVLAHECFHGVFGLPDEYYQNPQCDCVMRSAPNPQKLCDKDNHVGGGRNVGPPGSAGKDCWQIVQGRKAFNGTIKHPNPDWKYLEPGKQVASKTDYTDGTRSTGGELKWNGITLKSPPKTVIRIVDN